MLLLIDGDVIAYLSCPSRYRNDKGQIVMYDAKSSVTFSKSENEKYLRDVWDNFRKKVDTLKETLYATDYLMAVKGQDNFRDALCDVYKGNRKKPATEVSKFVPILRTLAACEDYAIEAHGREADDLLSIWATQAREAGEDFVVVSVDKDLKCIPGKHYNPKTSELDVISELYALRFFYQQMLSGDPTDNIPGIPGIGPVKAAGLLVGTATEEEMQEVIVEQYMTAFDDDWFEMILSNGKLLYLQKHADDYFTASGWEVCKSLRSPESTKAPEVVFQPPTSATAPPALIPKMAVPSLVVPVVNAASASPPNISVPPARLTPPPFRKPT